MNYTVYILILAVLIITYRLIIPSNFQKKYHPRSEYLINNLHTSWNYLKIKDEENYKFLTQIFNGTFSNVERSTFFTNIKAIIETTLDIYLRKYSLEIYRSRLKEDIIDNIEYHAPNDINSEIHQPLSITECIDLARKFLILESTLIEKYVKEPHDNPSADAIIIHTCRSKLNESFPFHFTIQSRIDKLMKKRHQKLLSN